MNNWKKSRTTKFFISFICMIFTAQHCFAGAIGTVTYVEGRGDILRANTKIPIPLREDDVVFVGDIMRTKTNSKIEVTFADKSMLRMAHSTRVEISDYQLDESNKRIEATINLQRGKVRAIVEKMKNKAAFNIHTPNAEGTIIGSDVFAFYQAGASGMLVAQGTLHIINPFMPTPTPMIITPGNSVLVPHNGAPLGPRPYIELEQTLHEQDVNPPVNVRRVRDIKIIEGSVTKTTGNVSITSKGTISSHAAKVNETLRTGDTIETGDNGMIEIRFDNGNAIIMKSNTHLTIVKLVIDPKTRTFDNLFEVKKGNVKAIVENMQQGSSFNIKTPHAISGVRGTIMYVGVQPNDTESFFEGGPGYTTSLVSGTTVEIPMGQTANADIDGNISNPVPVEGEIRFDLAEGWGFGQGIEGYSAPEGTLTELLFDDDTDVNAAAGEGEEGGTEEGTPGGNEAGGVTSASSTTGATSSNFVEVPVTESPTVTPLTTSPTPPPEPEPAPGPGPGPGPTPFSEGVFGGAFGSFDTNTNQLNLDGGGLDGIIGIDNAPWPGSQPLSLSGTFSDPASPLFHGSVSGSGDDGSEYLGFASGVNSSLTAFLYALYIRPNPAGGFLSGYLFSSNISGDFNIADGTFAANGTINAFLDLPTNVVPSQLFIGSPNLQVDTDVTGTGIIGGDDITGTTGLIEVTQIIDQGWLTFNMGAGGGFANLPANDFEAAIGGVDKLNTSEPGIWIGQIEGDSFANGEFSGSLFGRFLDFDDIVEESVLGTFQDGRILGVYDENDLSWQGLIGGAATLEPLAFNGTTDGNFGNFNANTDVFDRSGSFSALLGGTASPFTGSPDITVFGEFDNPQGDLTIWTDNDNFVTGRTSDGGAFFGLIGGTNVSDEVDDSLSGLFYALYVRPDGSSPTGNRAGILKSTDLAGDFRDGINMFEADGTITSFLDLPTDFTPGDLFDGGPALSIETIFELPATGIETTILVGGDISGEIVDGITMNFEEEPFVDIFRVEGGGTFVTQPSNNWQAVVGIVDHNDGTEGNGISDSFGIVHVSGDSFENGELSATFTGRSIDFSQTGPADDDELFQFQGDLLGTFDAGTNSWQAIGMGSSDGDQDFAFNAFGEGNFTHVNLVTFEEERSGSVSAILGGTQSPFTGTPDITVIGEFSNPEDGIFWASDEFVSGRTSNGGSLLGHFGGTSNDVAINKGGYNSFYIRPDGGGGNLAGRLFSNDLEGAFYPSIGMFELDGTLSTSQEAPTAFTPADLLDGTAIDDDGVVTLARIFNPDISGSIESDSLIITGQDWGLFFALASGNYQNLPANGSTAIFTGIARLDGEFDGSLLGLLTNNDWADNTFDGTVDSIGISLNYDTGTLVGTRSTGDTVGAYVDVSEGSTWEAGAAGEWVVVDELLDLAGIVDDITALGTLDIPVTEVFSSLLAGGGTFGVGGTITFTNFLLDFYTASGITDGIWAANIAGNYTAPTSNNWTATGNGNLIDSVTSNVLGPVSATLTGTEWGGGVWVADVAGVGPNGIALTGGAAGLIDAQGAGTFNGAGTGVFATP